MDDDDNRLYICPQDPGQQKLCSVGEACLYYSWRKSSSSRAVIRECFPTSVLLGTIEQPVLPQPSCSPMAVETGDIQACICTTDLCSGLAGQEDSAALATELEGVTADRPGQEEELAREVEAVFGGPQMAGGRVKCHQCGSLFSTQVKTALILGN